jgi:predicted RND superfamily exporter protein
LLVGLGAVRFADLTPEVSSEFFFAEDDPQLRAAAEIAERFPMDAQLVLRVADRGDEGAARRQVVPALTDALAQVDGVEGVFRVPNQDPDRSPLFRRALPTPDPAVTNIVLQVDDEDPETLVAAIESVIAENEATDVDVVLSGVPAIVEYIRRDLARDLLVFSVVAALVFMVLIGGVYRDALIVVGTMATCATSVAATLLIVKALGVPIGLLTANLVTIVFVLTLSHAVFMTANWPRVSAAEGSSTPEALERAVRDTFEGSLWSMLTTALGFASLLVATARPLRELGVAGGVGTVCALTITYLMYPAFLSASRARPVVADGPASATRPTGSRRLLPVALGVVLVAGLGVPRLDTDPSLLSYFRPGSQLREGLERIDADGGSSTLDIVVADPGGSRVDDRAVFERLERVQATFEADPAVGVVLSPTLLVGHARTIPLAGLLPVSTLLDLASSRLLGGVALAFVTSEREQARFSLRLRETAEEERSEVMARLTQGVRENGMEPVLVAGLYDLQAQLGVLIKSSLKIGIGGLLGLFLLVGLGVARSLRVALAMWACLAGIPLIVLGFFGHARIAVDIITSPAANIALAIGADSMIHLVVRVRTLGRSGLQDAWSKAVQQIAAPVLGAAAIISAGFGIFGLSTFPPTRRFGLAVIVGTLAAAALALLVLPRLAAHGLSPAALRKRMES